MAITTVFQTEDVSSILVTCTTSECSIIGYCSIIPGVNLGSNPNARSIKISSDSLTGKIVAL
jgi:hypothetical protein